MADNLSFTPQVALDQNGATVAGAQARFYLTGTSTPATVYADTSAAVVMAQPVLADANGVFPQVFSSGTGGLRCVIERPDGVEMSDVDPVATSPLSASGAAQVTFTPLPELGLSVANVQDAIEAVSGQALASVQTDLTLTAGAGLTGGGTLEADRTFAIDAATAAEAKAGEATDKVITPSVLSDGVKGALVGSSAAPVFAARAWAFVDGSATPPIIHASGNVASVTRTGTGLFAVTFTEPMGSANYAVIASGAFTDSPGVVVNTACIAAPTTLTASGFNITVGDNNTEGGYNPAFLFFAVFS